MRECDACQAEMADLLLSVAYNRWAITVRDNENMDALGLVKCLVCPKCGKISLHLDDLAKLQKHVKNQQVRS